MKNAITAITMMAVITVGLLVTGCATKRDIAEINSRLANIESQNRETRDIADRMDSLVTATVEANRQLQNDVRYSSDELSQQMSQLLENYNDLIARIDLLATQKPTVRQPLKPSPGATGGSSTEPTVADQPPPSAVPATDCIDTYDVAFTQVRRGEYDAAIDGFRRFLADCEGSDDVENAYYWIGECYYSQEKYTQAIAEYEHLLKSYPDSPNTGRALYKLARCKQETGKSEEARELFQRLVDEHAGTLEAEQAAQRLKDL